MAGVILWIVFCFIVAALGSSKRIGSVGAFFISLILSPLIGLIVVLASSPAVPVIRSNPEIDRLTKAAITEYNLNNFNSAMEILHKAVFIDATNAIVHFNFSTLYSKMKDKDNSYRHLTRAIECGYNKFENIQKSEDLNWLRNTPEYKDYVTNGYKFNVNTQRKTYIDELTELSKLKENGIISEIEFNEQKSKILAMNNP